MKKKQPFLDWLRSLPEPDLESTLKDIGSTCYMLPDFESDHEFEECLAEIHEGIFSAEMNGWWTEPNDWEKELSFEKFKTWFDYEICSLPLDLVEGNIEKQDF